MIGTCSSSGRQSLGTVICMLNSAQNANLKVFEISLVIPLLLFRTRRYDRTKE
jgi:hypothetical protein